MSNAYGGLDFLTATMKEIQARGEVASFVNRSCKFLKALGDGDAQETNSRGAWFAAEVEPNPSNRAFGEGGAYAFFNTAQDVRMRVFFRRHSRGRGFTRDELSTMKSQASMGSNKKFSQVVKAETQDLCVEANRQLWGDGSGLIAVASAAGGAIVTGANGTVNFGGTNSQLGSYDILRRGRYNFVSTAGVLRNGGGNAIAVVASKNPATQIVTFDQVPTDVVGGDGLYYEDSFMQGLHGVLYHVNNDTGLYQGTSRALYPYLRSPIQDAAVGGVPQPLSIALMDNLRAQSLYVYGEDDDATADPMRWQWWMSPTQEIAYLRLVDPFQRVIKDATAGTLDLGYKINGKGAKHAAQPFNVDRHHPDNRIDGLVLSTFKKFYAPDGKPGFIEDANGNYLRDVPGFSAAGVGTWLDLTGFYMGWRMDVGCLDPHANGAIINLSTAGLPNRKLAQI